MCLCSNGYSLYCAELMVNMKDVPSTERMVLCSKQWKLMTQKEKDMFQKRCEQVGTAHAGYHCASTWTLRSLPVCASVCSVHRERSSMTSTCRGSWRYVASSGPSQSRSSCCGLLNKPFFTQSLPEEERDRVMTEEKLGGAKLTGAATTSPHRTRLPSVKV